VSGGPSGCRTCDELLEVVRRLESRVAAQDRRIEDVEAENRKLRGLLDEALRAGKRQAGPFSKGDPKADPKPPGRKPGKEHGPAASRPPPRRIDEIHDAPLPDRCAECGGKVEETGVAHQYQTEIPRPRPVHRRFDVHVGRCTCCGKRVQGRHPLQTSDALGAAASQLGPEALALAAHLHKVLGATYGKVRSFFHAAFGVTVSRGGLARALHRVAERFEPTYDVLLRDIRGSPVVYPDETSSRMAGVLWWLWAFVTPKTTVYVQRNSRGFDVIEEILGRDFQGALGHDGWAPYDKLALADHQQCLAHLLRRAKELLEQATRGAVRFPRAVRSFLKDALALRDRRDNAAISPRGFAIARGRIAGRLDRLLAKRLTHDANRRFRDHLRRHADQLLTFLYRIDVEATAWMADHAIRPAVLFRKVSGGHRSPRGARTHDVLTSVFRTCRQRAADALALTVRALCSPKPRVLRIAAAR
jgi:transposase